MEPCTGEKRNISKTEYMCVNEWDTGRKVKIGVVKVGKLEFVYLTR